MSKNQEPTKEMLAILDMLENSTISIGQVLRVTDHFIRHSIEVLGEGDFEAFGSEINNAHAKTMAGELVKFSKDFDSFE